MDDGPRKRCWRAITNRVLRRAGLYKFWSYIDMLQHAAADISGELWRKALKTAE